MLRRARLLLAGLRIRAFLGIRKIRRQKRVQGLHVAPLANYLGQFLGFLPALRAGR